MKKLPLFSTISIEMKTQWGIINVDFTIVDILPDDKYALIAQNRLCVGQLKPDGRILLSDYQELLNVELLKGKPYNKTEFTF